MYNTIIYLAGIISEQERDGRNVEVKFDLVVRCSFIGSGSPVTVIDVLLNSPDGVLDPPHTQTHDSPSYQLRFGTSAGPQPALLHLSIDGNSRLAGSGWANIAKNMGIETNSMACRLRPRLRPCESYLVP